jgi:pimeloyl-ACP methyl ester carboxylesterase
VPTIRHDERVEIAGLQQAVRQSNSVETLARTMPATLVSAATAELQPELLAHLGARIRTAQPAAVAWCQEAMASRPDSLTTLRSAGALPALVLCGSDDDITPMSDHEQLVAALRDVGGHPQFVVVPSAGHLVPMEAPEQSCWPAACSAQPLKET